jgi:hypothetical protein
MSIEASGTSVLPLWVEWVSALAPFATLVSAVIAGTIAVLSLAQRRRADAKAEWWRRFEWAADHVLDDDPHGQEVGVGTLLLLARSDLARAEELELVDATWGALLDEAAPTGGRPVNDAPRHRTTGEGGQLTAQSAPGDAVVTRAQVRAARARLEIASRLGTTPPPWVRDVASATDPGPPDR